MSSSPTRCLGAVRVWVFLYLRCYALPKRLYVLLHHGVGSRLGRVIIVGLVQQVLNSQENLLDADPRPPALIDVQNALGTEAGGNGLRCMALWSGDFVAEVHGARDRQRGAHQTDLPRRENVGVEEVGCVRTMFGVRGKVVGKAHKAGLRAEAAPGNEAFGGTDG